MLRFVYGSILTFYLVINLLLCNSKATAKRCLGCIRRHATELFIEKYGLWNNAYMQIVVTWYILKMQSRFSFAVLPLVLTHSGAHETPLFCWNGTIHIAVIFHPVSLCLQQWGRGVFLLHSIWQFFFLAAAVFFLFVLFVLLNLYFPLFLKVFVWISSFGTPSIAGFRNCWLISEIFFFLRWWIISLNHETKSDLLFHITLSCWL